MECPSTEGTLCRNGKVVLPLHPDSFLSTAFSVWAFFFFFCSSKTRFMLVVRFFSFLFPPPPFSYYKRLFFSQFSLLLDIRSERGASFAILLSPRRVERTGTCSVFSTASFLPTSGIYMTIEYFGDRRPAKCFFHRKVPIITVPYLPPRHRFLCRLPNS